MHKIKLILLISLLTAVLVTTFVGYGCAREAAAPPAEAPATEAPATEAPAEEVAAEEPAQEEEVVLKGTPVLEPKLPVPDDVEGAGDYTGEYSYEYFREQALAGEFNEDYAKDFKLAVTNLAASVPICTQIVNSIVEYWKLAGGTDANTLVLDNAFDVSTMIKNSDTIIAWGPDAFVNYGMDEQSNEMISKKAEEAGFWSLGLDVTMPGYPFMGGDNWANGELSAGFAIDYINSNWGGIDEVDRVYYCWNPAFGEVVSYRKWGARKVFVEEFGHQVDFLVDGSKAVLVEISDDFQAPWLDMLAKYPNDEKIVVFAPYEAAAGGFYAAAETLGVWDSDNILLNSLGGDDLGRPLLRSGITDSTVAWVPETYGTYVIPLVLANLYGNPVPAVTYLEHVVLTQDNLDDYYPGETELYTE
jgi:ABC-type sugar transport system substrate-binding protein